MPSNAGYPALFVGQRWTATLAQSTLPIQAWKISGTTKNNTAAATADPDLTLPVEANAVYRLIYALSYTTTTAADIRWTWSFPAGTTGYHVISGLEVAGAAVTQDVTIRYDLSATAGSGGITAGTIVGIHGVGYIDTSATAGSLTLNWAQFVATVVNTTLEAGSFIELKRME